MKAKMSEHNMKIKHQGTMIVIICYKYHCREEEGRLL